MNDFIAYRGSSLTSVLYLYDIFNYFNYREIKQQGKIVFTMRGYLEIYTNETEIETNEIRIKTEL